MFFYALQFKICIVEFAVDLIWNTDTWSLLHQREKDEEQLSGNKDAASRISSVSHVFYSSGPFKCVFFFFSRGSFVFLDWLFIKTYLRVLKKVKLGVTHIEIGVLFIVRHHILVVALIRLRNLSF